MHGLPDHDQVMADCRDVHRVQFGTTRIQQKLADFGYRAEDVVESIAEIPWAQSGTASATAEAATRSSMYGVAQTSTRSPRCSESASASRPRALSPGQ